MVTELFKDGEVTGRTSNTKICIDVFDVKTSVVVVIHVIRDFLNLKMSIDEREVESALEGAGKSLLDIVEEKNRTLNKVRYRGRSRNFREERARDMKYKPLQSAAIFY